MRNTTVTGPLLSVSSTAPAGQQNRFAAVHLLTGESLYFIVEGKSRVKDVNAQLANYMTTQGMQAVELFSLAIVVEDEYFFTDAESKLSKYSPKGWKSSSTHGLDQNGQPLLQLHLRVKYYVDTAQFQCDEISLQHYYLQLRENIAARGGTMEDVNHQNVLHLVALGLQADFGDHTADPNITSELLEKYLPPKAYKNNEHKVKQTLNTLHQTHKGISKNLAQTMFVQMASPLHKAHLYRMKLNKSQPKQSQGGALSTCNNAWMAIFRNGIQLFHESLSQALSCLYLWNNVMRLSFDRKKFELRTKTKDILVYYADSDEKCKRIVMICHHTNEYISAQTKTYDKLPQKNNTPDKSKFYGLKWANEKKSKTKSNKTDSSTKQANDTTDEKKCDGSGECSDDTSNLTADQNADPTVATSPADDTIEKVSNGSVSSSVELGYSHTAENSTASELDYSVQSAQDSSEAYMMYRNPRARAAYVDNSNQSARTSSGVYTCSASYSTVSKDTASASYTTENSSSVDCNDGGDYGKAAVAHEPDAAGAAALQSAIAPPPDAVGPSPRPPDTASAAVSSASGDNGIIGDARSNGGKRADAAVDDCDGRGGGGDGAAELYDLSAVCSDGGLYCGGGDTATADAAASVVAPPPPSSSKRPHGCCGCEGGRCAAARLNGGRSRSGSVVSNSDSFHGDGSDPPEGGGRGALLSAAELSDLIVGRESLQTPRKGYYPSRPTTSSTLDSDSDYVTMPAPMNFVTGAPSLSNLSLTNFECGGGGGNVVPPCHWDVCRPIELLQLQPNNVVKYCDGHRYNHHLYHLPCVQVNSNNYLDVHKSGSSFYHHVYPMAAAAIVPPHLHARQPPPPPPPPPPPRPKPFDAHLLQEQYKRQLRSDADFGVYPLQDPSGCRQQYADAEFARNLRYDLRQHYHRYEQLDPPSYHANNSSYLYRSAPNVAAAASLSLSPVPAPPPPLPPPSSLMSHHNILYPCQQQQQHPLPQRPLAPTPPLPPIPPHLKYASDQTLLFPATVAAAAEYAARNPHRRRPMRPMPLPRPAVRSSHSHDDLLAATAPAVPPKASNRRRPPPPPPPVVDLQKPPSLQSAAAVLDIESLREKSRNLDLPLISALCNDQTLLKQTNSLLPAENQEAAQTAAAPSISASSSSSSSAAAAKPSSHQPAAPPQPATCKDPQQNGGAACKSAKCANGASSFASQTPQSFMSAAGCTPTSASSVSAAAAAVKSVKSSKVSHVKTNTNVV